MATKKANGNNGSHFKKGSGCFTCKVCGKKTRATGQNDNEHLQLCVACFDQAGDENAVSDGHITQAEFNSKYNGNGNNNGTALSKLPAGTLVQYYDQGLRTAWLVSVEGDKATLASIPAHKQVTSKFTVATANIQMVNNSAQPDGRYLQAIKLKETTMKNAKQNTNTNTNNVNADQQFVVVTAKLTAEVKKKMTNDNTHDFIVLRVLHQLKKADVATIAKHVHKAGWVTVDADQKKNTATMHRRVRRALRHLRSAKLVN